MRLPSAYRIHIRFWRHLLWEFRWPLGVFVGLVLGGGAILDVWYTEQPLDLAEACYEAILLIFVQSHLTFPDEWYLRPLFFLFPIVGLGAVADSLVRLAYLLFARKSNLPEWHRMVASLYRNHVVVLGAGKVGFRIARGLLDLQEPVVMIERTSESHLVEDLVDRGVPVIRGDGRLAKTLEQAGIRHARALVLATSDDLANLDAALTARDLNPAIRVVLRLFDDTLAEKFAGTFSMPAISTARVSAPAFIAAATGRKVYQQFELSGQPVHLTDITVAASGELSGRTVGDVQSRHGVNIVMHSGAAGVNVNPGHDLSLAADDHLLVIAPMGQLVSLEQANGRSKQ